MLAIICVALALAFAGAQAPPQGQDEAVRQRVKEFLTAWLMERDREKTMAFLDESVYERPPGAGEVCDGWYKRGYSKELVRKIIAKNLMDSADDYPKGTPLDKILFTHRLPLPFAKLPEQFTPLAANPVDQDRFFLVRVNQESLGKLFGPAGGDQMGEKSEPTYLAVLPTVFTDGDAFIVFTIWQQVDGSWRIVGIDAACQ